MTKSLGSILYNFNYPPSERRAVTKRVSIIQGIDFIYGVELSSAGLVDKGHLVPFYSLNRAVKSQIYVTATLYDQGFFEFSLRILNGRELSKSSLAYIDALLGTQLKGRIVSEKEALYKSQTRYFIEDVEFKRNDPLESSLFTETYERIKHSWIKALRDITD